MDTFDNIDRWIGDLRLITFDLDDTCWPCWPVIQAAEQTLFAWLSERVPGLADDHDIGSLRQRRQQLAEQRPSIAHDLSALRLAMLETLLVEYGQPEALATQGLAIFNQARNRVQPYGDVADVLRVLRAEFQLISLTNGNSDIDQTPLAGLFHVSLGAADVGAAKPDPALFHAALDDAGVTAGRALHVGDDPRRDIVPAAALGMYTVWINRNGAGWPLELPPPTFILPDLSRLPHLLGLETE